MDPQVIREAIPEILTQLLAFLLVLWILKKYAFGAVFKILEERQKTIAHSLDRRIMNSALLPTSNLLAQIASF